MRRSEPVRVFAINFRSVFHMLWFVVSMLLITVTIWAATMYILVGQNLLAVINSLVVSGLEFVTMVSAIIFTKGGKVNDGTWSRDCIWWNGVLCVIALAFAGIAYLRM